MAFGRVAAGEEQAAHRDPVEVTTGGANQMALVRSVRATFPDAAL